MVESVLVERLQNVLKNVKLLCHWHHGLGSFAKITQTVKISLKRVIPATFDQEVFLCFFTSFLANYFSV